MIRVTVPPPSVLSAWSHGVASDSAGIAELTRAVVSQEWRNAGLYKLMMAYTVLAAARNYNTTSLQGAIELDFHGWPFLASLGFCALGEPKAFLPPPGNRLYVGQVISCPLTAQVVEQARVIFFDLNASFAQKVNSASAAGRTKHYVTLETQHTFCDQMELLRRQGFAENENWSSSKDQFDECSTFTVAYLR